MDCCAKSIKHKLKSCEIFLIKYKNIFYVRRFFSRIFSLFTDFEKLFFLFRIPSFRFLSFANTHTQTSLIIQENELVSKKEKVAFAISSFCLLTLAQSSRIRWTTRIRGLLRCGRRRLSSPPPSLASSASASSATAPQFSSFRFLSPPTADANSFC